MYLREERSAVFAVRASLSHDVEMLAIFRNDWTHCVERLEDISTKDGVCIIVRGGCFGRLCGDFISDFRQGVVVSIFGL